MRNGFCLLPVALACAGAPLSGIDAEPAPLLKLRPVPFTQVRIRDSFWAARQETNRVAAIAINLAMLEKAGNIHNFELAAAGATNGYSGPVFMDSDLYKGLESVAYSLAIHPDADLERRLEAIISKIAAAQQPDGYLDTYYIVKEPGKRWTNLRDCHELYCAGHLFEAAVAHYQATGKRAFLDVAVKLANHIDSVFGPGKRLGYPGHPEIEPGADQVVARNGRAALFQPGPVFHRKPRAPLFCRGTPHAPGSLRRVLLAG